jgi:hypothetical protein
MGRFRFLLDGHEHRWTKWILDYDLDTQLRFFDRIAGGDGPSAPDTQGERSSWLRLGGGLLAAGAVLIALLFIRSSGGAGASPESRAYVRMRRAYAGWGIALAGSPPLEFAAELRRTRAPGFDAAARAVHAYVRARFGNELLGAVGREALRRDVKAAVSAVRRERVRRLFRRDRPADPS